MILADIHQEGPPRPDPPTTPIPPPITDTVTAPKPLSPLPHDLPTAPSCPLPTVRELLCSPLRPSDVFSSIPGPALTALFCFSSALSERQPPRELLKPLMKPFCDSKCSPLLFCGKPYVVSLAGGLPAAKCTPSDSGFGERAENSNGAPSGKKPC